MRNMTRKVMNFFSGLWEIGKENLEPLVAKVIERGEQQRQQRSGPMTEMTEGEDAFFERVGEFTRTIIKEMGLARQENLEALEKRVAELEENLKSRQADQNLIEK